MKSLGRVDVSVAVSTRAGSRVDEGDSVVDDDLELETFEVEETVTRCWGCGCRRVAARDGVVVDVVTLEHVGKDRRSTVLMIKRILLLLCLSVGEEVKRC